MGGLDVYGIDPDLGCYKLSGNVTAEVGTIASMCRVSDTRGSAVVDSC